MTSNHEPEETGQPQEETNIPSETVIVDEVDRASVEDGIPPAPGGPAVATNAPPEFGGAPAGEATSYDPPGSVLVHQEDEPLTCAVCGNPIERFQGYLQAAYGPVHQIGCSHQPKAL